MDEQIHDLLAIYALGGATEAEAQQVEALVAEDAAAAAELAELTGAAAALPYAAAPMPVSAETAAAVVARAAADVSGRQATAVSVSRPKKATTHPRLTIWEQVQAFLSRPIWAGAGLALAALVLVWALSLRQQIGTLQETAVADATRIAELAAENSGLTDAVSQLEAENGALSGELATLREQNGAQANELALLLNENEGLRGEVAGMETAVAELDTAVQEQQVVQEFFASTDLYSVTLPGTDAFPEATAQIIVDPENNLAMLVVTGLDPLPQDTVYQVLLIRDTEHETAETFRVSTDGEGVLLVHSAAPIDSFDAVGVSIEPDGGSEQRTGDIVVLGSFIN